LGLFLIRIAEQDDPAIHALAREHLGQESVVIRRRAGHPGLVATVKLKQHEDRFQQAEGIGLEERTHITADPLRVRDLAVNSQGQRKRVPLRSNRPERHALSHPEEFAEPALKNRAGLPAEARAMIVSVVVHEPSGNLFSSVGSY